MYIYPQSVLIFFSWRADVLKYFNHSICFSPTGSHVEWCKQLIAATISSQISGSVTSENVSRDYKVSSIESLIHFQCTKKLCIFNFSETLAPWCSTDICLGTRVKGSLLLDLNFRGELLPGSSRCTHGFQLNGKAVFRLRSFF